MIKDKVKALFAITGTKQTEIAEKLGISKQHLNMNINSHRTRADELIKYAHYTGTQLAFIDKEGNVVVKFDMNDL